MLIHRCFPLLIVSSLISLASGGLSLPPPPIKDKSFTMRANIKIELNLKQRSTIQLEESYSVGQRRTKIKFKVLGEVLNDDDRNTNETLPSEGAFYLDQWDNVLLVARDECSRSSREMMRKLFGTEHFVEPLRNSQGMEMFGASAALLYIDRLRGEFKQANEFGISVRNVPAIMFVRFNDPQSIYAIYAKAQIQRDDKRPVAPMRLAMTTSGLHVEYEILQVRTFERSSELLSDLRLEQDDALELDKFATQRAVGCSALAGFSSAQVSPKAQVSRFSLKAQVQLPNSLKTFSSIAYESSLKMLRADLETGDSFLINLHSGHLYHTTRSGPLRSNNQTRLEIDGQGDESCVLARIASWADAYDGVSAYDAYKVLLGARLDQFVHLGLARVRGQWTRAYEAHATNWPLWLEPPIQFERNWSNGLDESAPKRKHLHDPATNAETLTTVIYLSDEETDGEPPRLFHMEIFVKHSASTTTRVPIRVLQFATDLRAHAPDNTPIELAFSLANRCLAATGRESNHYAQVDMILASSPASQLDQLQAAPSNLRNLAILVGIQKSLKLPSTLVYDLNSRLVVKQSNDNEMAAIQVTFRLARHRQSVSNLRLYGTGGPVQMYRSQLASLHATLGECFLQAAHQKRDTFFAHSPGSQLCLVDRQTEPQTVGEKAATDRFVRPKRFQLFTNGPMNVYFVHHAEDRELIVENPIGTLSSKYPRFYSNKQMMTKFPLAIGENAKLEFLVKSFNMHELDEKHSFRIDDDLESMADTNKFVGLSLVSNDTTTRVIRNVDQPMDFNTCETTCLTDPKCRSFSICLQRGAFECLTSSVNFREAKLLIKLVDIQAKRDTHFGQLFQIPFLTNNSMSTSLIQVRKQANCELHNKHYLNLFHSPVVSPRPRSTSTSSVPALYQVSGRDDCARLCYEQTYLLLDQDVHSNLSSVIEEQMADENLEDEELQRRVKQLVGQHQLRVKSLCREFQYLDGSIFAALPTKFKELVRSASSHRAISPLDDLQSDNFCLTGDLPRELTTTFLSDDHLKALQELKQSDLFRNLHFERHSFRMELLFEKKYGTRLMASKMSKEEAFAYDEVRLLQSFKRTNSMHIMRRFLEKHENAQDFMMMSNVDVSACALMCMLQIKNLWPSCRSFDLVVVSTGDKVSAFCRFNTLTLREAIKYSRVDLIDEQENKLHNVQVWHYDPKSGSIQDEMDLERQVDIAGAHVAKQKQITSGVDVAITMALVFLSLYLGLLIGVKLARRSEIIEEEAPIQAMDARDSIDLGPLEVHNP